MVGEKGLVEWRMGETRAVMLKEDGGHPVAYPFLIGVRGSMRWRVRWRGWKVRWARGEKICDLGVLGRVSNRRGFKIGRKEG